MSAKITFWRCLCVFGSLLGSLSFCVSTAIAQSVGQPILVWAFEKGPLPDFEDIDGLSQAVAAHGENVNLIAWLGILTEMGVPGRYGRHQGLAAALIDDAMAQQQADSALYSLGGAIQDQNGIMVRQILDGLGGDGLNARQLDTLRVYEQLAIVAGLVDGDSSNAVESLQIWFHEEQSVQAGVGLFIARVKHGADIGQPARLLAEQLDERSPRTAWLIRAMLDTTVAMRARDEFSSRASLNSLRRSAELGTEFSINRLAFELWEGSELYEQDREEAVYWLMHQVCLEDSQAAILLAQAWLTGDGCERNEEAAAALLLRYSMERYHGVWEGPDADAIQEALAKGPPYRASSEEVESAEE